MEYLATLHPVRDLGTGAHGLVRLCKDEVHGDVAAKFFFRINFSDLGEWQAASNKALAEAQALKALEHRNVVRIHHVLRSPAQDEFLLVMEYCDHGSAKGLTETNIVKLARAKRVILDAAIGLNYIHTKGFLHRDIKPDNILLNSKTETKVGDFGFVTDKLTLGFATPYGTPCYLAPEVPVDLVCSEISDVYSLGVTFLHLLHGDHWFCRQGSGQMFDWSAGFPTLSPRAVLLPHIPTKWRNCLANVTRTDTSKRCQSMDEAVNLISRLPAVENWKCRVEPDKVSWKLLSDNSSRIVQVEWENYLRKGDRWRAWSEGTRGQNVRTLAQSNNDDRWQKNYRGLQQFFAERQKRLV